MHGKNLQNCNSISYGIRMRCVEWRIHKVPSTSARFFRQTTRTVNYHTLVLFYKIRQNLAPKYLCTLVPDLSSTTSGYSFRKFSYPVPLTQNSATLESFLPRAIILWNDLPTNVQSSKTLSTFKTKLRVHLSL